MIHAVYAIVIIVIIIIFVVVFRSKRSTEVWHKIVAKTDTHEFVLEGYEDNVKCFLFKIHKNGRDWSLLQDFANREEAHQFLSECLGTQLELLADQEMADNIPPPRILDLSPARR